MSSEIYYILRQFSFKEFPYSFVRISSVLYLEMFSQIRLFQKWPHRPQGRPNCIVEQLMEIVCY